MDDRQRRLHSIDILLARHISDLEHLPQARQKAVVLASRIMQEVRRLACPPREPVEGWVAVFRSESGKPWTSVDVYRTVAQAVQAHSYSEDYVGCVHVDTANEGAE